MKKIFFCILIVLISKYNFQNLDDLITEREKNLENLLNESIILFNKLYESPCNINCSQCFYHACSKLIPELTCSKDFKIDSCKNCEETGTRLSKMFPTLKTPVIFEKFNKLDKNTLCSLSPISSTFKKNFLESSGSIKFQYFGSKTGLFYLYPGSLNCKTFDPRYRPWLIFFFICIEIIF